MAVSLKVGASASFQLLMWSILLLAVAARAATPVMKSNSLHCHDVHNTTASCCLHVSSTHIIKFNDNVCLNSTLQIAPDRSLANSSLEFVIGIDGKPLGTKIYPLAHLGKGCVDIPDIPDSEICAEFEDTNLTATEFTTCIDLTLEARSGIESCAQLHPRAHCAAYRPD